MINLKIIYLTTITIFLLFPVLSYSEPSDEVRILIREPVSLFDLGIYKLRNNFSDTSIVDYTGKNIKIESSVHYDFDKNTIQIKGKTNATAIDESMAKKWCNHVIARFRLNLLADPLMDEDAGAGASAFFLELMFSHEGYVKGEKPKDLYKQLTSIIELIGIAKFDTIKDKHGYIECRNSLTNSKVYFSEDITSRKAQ